MFGTNTAKWMWILGGLVFANIVYYFYSNWGLVTVKVTNAPLSSVIRSIEWQGWVKIYTNLPLDSKVTMYADHVPLAEAMETLAANVDVPPNPDGDTPRPRRNRPDAPGDANARPPGGGAFGGNVAGGPAGANGAPPGGRGAGGGGGGGGGGFGRAAQWNLAFFVAPTASEVKQEILAFETGDPNEENKVFTYGTPMQLISSDSLDTTPDPRLQAWPGVKPVDPAAAAAKLAANPPPDPAQNGAADPPANAGPPNVQTYLEDFAASSNVWIMAPGSWTQEVTAPPPANPSIIGAIKNFISGEHGYVTQAIVLRAGRGGARGGTRSDFGDDDALADRMRNAINGLPPAERPDALDQLNHEIQFRKDMRAIPPEQRRQRMAQHMAERMLYGERLSRLSPEKRAKVYQRMLALRAASKAQK